MRLCRNPVFWVFEACNSLILIDLIFKKLNCDTVSMWRGRYLYYDTVSQGEGEETTVVSVYFVMVRSRTPAWWICWNVAPCVTYRTTWASSTTFVPDKASIP